MATMNPSTTRKRDQWLQEIAKEVLGLDTLETRKSDSLDFSEQAVWNLKNALEQAFAAGMAAAR